MPLPLIPILVSAGATAASVILAEGERAKVQNNIQTRESAIAALEADRIAPFDPSTIVTDRSGQITNPYANIGVATEAARIQTEETDKALANTLDTLRATGAGAGGATALAMAAIKGKNEVTASIQQQEVENQKLKAAGEQQMQQAKLAELARVESAQVEGAKFFYEKQAEIDKQQLDRAQGMLDQERAMDNALYQAQISAVGGMVSGLGDIIQAAYSGGSGGNQ